jgi:hypothetical protein
VVDGDAMLGEQFFDVAIGQSVAQIPAHHQHDDLTGKRNPAKPDLGGGTRRWRRRIGSACLKLSSTNTTIPIYPYPTPFMHQVHRWIQVQGNRLNVIMKQITNWAATIAVPTTITGFYGQHVPYPGHEFGCYVSTTIIAVLSVGLYVLFRHRGWI